MFNIRLCSHLAFLGTSGHISSLMKNCYTLGSLRRVWNEKIEINTAWQIGRLLVQGTCPVSYSVIWVSMWPTDETNDNCLEN